MGEGSEGLFKLRAVSFRYKAEIDSTGLEQYGLVAEEVAEVYPDLVTRDAAGEPQAVRYHFLVPMLLNEVQKDRRTIEEQRLRLESEQAELKDMKARLTLLEALFAGGTR
jgi:trimeric autotransporter adhesin